MYEITQLGDALIMFSIISLFIVYAPKVFEALLVASLISLIVSFILKKIFSIPRPAAMLADEKFTIIGKVLKGYSSFPSGHSMTVFIALTIIIFAFIHIKKNINFYGIF